MPTANLFAVENVASSSGKLFVPDLTPRRFDEWLVGTAKQFTTGAVGAAYFRYRKGTHLLGGHEQQRPRSRSIHRPAFRASSTSRT